MKSFSQYTLLMESTEESTLMEGTIVACWNKHGQGEEAFKANILNDDDVKKWKSKSKEASWQGTKVSKLGTEELKDALWSYAELLKSKAPSSGNADHSGSKKLKVSAEWSARTGKGKDTSKADIIVDTGVSVKGPKALLMSGEQKESKATALAAYDSVKSLGKDDTELRGKIEAKIDDLITTTKTAGQVPKKLVTKYKLRPDRQGEYWMTTTNVAKISKEDLKTMGNAQAKEVNAAAKIAYNKARKVKTELEGLFAQAFNNAEVQKAFAWESMTGWEKFAGNVYGSAGDTAGFADQMLVWHPNMEQVKWHAIKQDGPYTSSVAAQMSMKADMKSGSYKAAKKKAGYSFFQTVRFGIDTTFDETDKIQKEANDQISKYEMMLTEGTLDEGRFLDKVKEIIVNLTGKLKAVWNAFTEKLIQAKDYIVELFNKGIESIMAFFELDISVSATLSVSL